MIEDTKEFLFDTRRYTVENGKPRHSAGMAIVMSRSDAVRLATALINELGNLTDEVEVRLYGELIG
jgi:hypothetical protein